MATSLATVGLMRIALPVMGGTTGGVASYFTPSDYLDGYWAALERLEAAERSEEAEDDEEVRFKGLLTGLPGQGVMLEVESDDPVTPGCENCEFQSSFCAVCTGVDPRNYQFHRIPSGPTPSLELGSPRKLLMLLLAARTHYERASRTNPLRPHRS